MGEGRYWARGHQRRFYVEAGGMHFPQIYLLLPQIQKLAGKCRPIYGVVFFSVS